MDKATKLKNWRYQLSKIQKRANELESFEQILSFYGRLARQYESSSTRYTFIAKKLREEILEIMETHGIREFKASSRTFLRIDYVFAIPDDEEGKIKVSQIQKIFGRKLAERLVEKEETVIPRHRVVHYKVVPVEINKLNKTERDKLSEILGNKPKLFIIDIPKRTRQGKGIRKYRGN